MQITLNGAATELPEDATTGVLLAQLALAGQRIAFEINGEIVPRSQRDAHPLKHGDRVEVVQAIGGG